MLIAEICAELASAVVIGFEKMLLNISTKTEIALSCRFEACLWVGVHVGRRYLLTMATPVGTGPIVQDVAPKGGYPPVSKVVECNGQLCSVFVFICPLGPLN